MARPRFKSFFFIGEAVPLRKDEAAAFSDGDRSARDVKLLHELLDGVVYDIEVGDGPGAVILEDGGVARRIALGIAADEFEFVPAIIGVLGGGLIIGAVKVVSRNPRRP